MGIRREEEMEMSDDENCDSPTKKLRVDESGNAVTAMYPRGIVMIFLILGGVYVSGDGHITHFYVSYTKLSSLSDSAFINRILNSLGTW